MFSVSGGDPDRSPALKWAAEVLLTAPADSPYVFLLNFFYLSYVVVAGLKRKNCRTFRTWYSHC